MSHLTPQNLITGQVRPTKFNNLRTVNFNPDIKDVDDYLKLIEKNGIKIGYYLKDIFGNSTFNVTAKETKLHLVGVLLADLGFKNATQLKYIFNIANSKGFQHCPIWIAFELRLQYKNQPKGNRLFIGMEPIIDSDGISWLLYLECDHNGLWLDALCDDSTIPLWPSSYQFVFVQPRK